MHILLASPYRPRALLEGVDAPDPFVGCLPDGPLAMTGRGHYWAFYLLAENLRAESCVLEHPTCAEFEAALRQGYDILCLQVNRNTIACTADMVLRARQLAPATRIVVGGYGVSDVLDPYPADEDAACTIREEAHYLCCREGVRFMRELLDDRPVERPTTQRSLPEGRAHLPAVDAAVPFLGGQPILVSLGGRVDGAPTATSAFFRHRTLEVATPADVHALMRDHLHAVGTSPAHFTLFADDFFRDPGFSRRLGARLREDGATRGRVAYSASGSVRQLSLLDPEELVANGLGVARVLVDGRRRTTTALFQALHEVGIQTIATLALGSEAHTPASVEDDIDAFLTLEPTVADVSLPLRHHTRELERLVERATQRLSEETGPAGLRALDIALRGHLRLRARRDPALRAHAARLRDLARLLYPLLEGVLATAPPARVRARVRETAERWSAAFGPPDEELAARTRACVNRVREAASLPASPAAMVDPPTSRTYYRPDHRGDRRAARSAA